jgi:hypothetical protein
MRFRTQSVNSSHFQTVTIRHGFISLGFQAFLKLSPVGSGVNAIGKHGDHLVNREMPFLLRGVPGAADLLFLE